MNTDTIKKGYYLAVTSWENDGDNYSTACLNGLTKKDIEFIIPFIELFGDCDEDDEDNGISNICQLDEEEEKIKRVFTSFIKSHSPKGTSFEKNFENGFSIVDNCYDIASHFGLTGSSDFYTRVLEDYCVYWIPFDCENLVTSAGIAFNEA